jgi:hypothetical protein
MARKNKETSSMIAGNTHVLPAVMLHFSLLSCSFFDSSGAVVGRK